MEQRILAALLVYTLSGCSSAFTTRFRSDEPGSHLRCTSSRVAPAFDTVLAIPAAVVTVAGFAIAVNPEHGGPVNDEKKVRGYGLVVGIAGALLLGASVASARHGFHHARRCESARRGGSDRCREAFEKIAGPDFLSTALPSGCALATAEASFASLDAGKLTTLGEDGDLRRVRSTKLGTGAVRVWLDDDSVVVVELVAPPLPRPWAQLSAELGDPDDIVSSRGGDHPSDLQWVYATRGLAVIVREDAVHRLLLFPPTTAARYRAHLSPGTSATAR